jgi:hypothetical protein
MWRVSQAYVSRCALDVVRITLLRFTVEILLFELLELRIGGCEVVGARIGA